ncbi:hypothetical protein VE01_07248 [Pseudogymnoascus verrucosus]|uniref:Uncharacterized protein n=1 Tax=Pseudogymnoascus verrucosus TaxID=342668 RepID=A0A1B8GF59_9PEZI|nr:uncharacterized protein VE01_07248 [Pseudogymnoascus verrucosus]OBT94461.1 hypothetical protein VE01_07248 [Pseudogymnoascus verrucosus]
MPSEDPDNDDGDGMSYRATANKTPPQLQFQPSPPPAQPKSGAAPMDDMLFMDPPTASHRDENPEPTAASPIATPLTLTRSGFLNNPNTTVPSLFSRSTHRSYDPIDGSSDRDADGFSANTSPLLTTSEGSKGDDLAGFRRRLDTDTTTSPARFETDDNDDAVTASTALLHEPVVRRASTRGVRVRHPTPGLQTLQGAYTANVVQLERSAEKLSMTSSIEDSIRNAYEEVKKSDSRMNSLRQSSLMNLVTDIPYEGVSTSTQLTSAVEVASPLNFASPTFPTRDTNSLHSTTSTSILDVNNAARSGGYSPGGAVILGARPRADSKTSKTSKYGTRPEPEMEGRPLSEFVPSRNNSYLSSRNVSRAPSIAEKEEEEAAVRRPLAIRNLSADDIDVDEEKTDIGLNKLVPDDSQSEMDQAQELFDDFDGQHYANMAAPPANAPPPPPAAEPRPDIQKRRDSSANTLSMARPKSYADPLTGQQMVFYPAPVPSMLMLPQKLSNRPSPAKREKRRTQALSTLPPLALQSAPWLQDVVEGQQTEQSQQIPDEVLDAEYLAQHHKQKVGGRRSTQDLLHMPEQLRANEFFEQPQPHQLVEIKEQSAVATLDNILDASAYAPVSAFTDHAYAGRLGAEVYGAHDPRATRTKSQLLAPPEAPKKRVSSFFGLGLGGGDKSDRARSSTVTSMLGLDKTPSYTAVADDSHSPRLPPSPSNGLDNTGDGDEFDADGPPSPRERDHDDTYIGAPTTLLAELQLRKQHAKTRTQNLTQAAGSRSTLLELDAVALVESKARQQKRVTLAWQEQHPEEEEEDDDVPLGVLFPGQSLQQLDRASRPMGLMERRELEDNEPLSQRRDRLLGRGGLQREPLRRHTPEPGHTPEPAEDSNPLPNARPVSGAFSLELLNQFGDPSPPDAAPEEEEEETLGQRRRRLLAEREAAAKPAPKQRRSMADILSAHPAASRGEYPHLAEHLQQQQQKQQQQRSAGHRQSIFPTAPQLYPEMGMNYQSQVGGGMGSGMTGREMVEQMKAIRARQAQQGGWGQQQMWQGMAAQGMGPQQGGGVDMVERWRRSVMLPGA